MDYQRKGQRSERRRRVLLEEALTPPEGSDREDLPGQPSPPAGLTGRVYSESALDAQQPPLTSLIPKRFSTVVLLGLLLVVMAGAVIAADVASQHLPIACRAAAASLRVDSPGSVRGWFSAMLLSATAGYSVLVYWLRRHRLDDYRGSYRIWMWSAPFFLIASILQVARVDLTCAAVLQEQAALFASLPTGLLASLILGVPATLWGLRLIFDMRRSAAATLSMLCAAACALAAFSFRGGALAADATKLVEAACSLGANFFVLGSVVLYARNVHRAAQVDRWDDSPPARRRAPRGSRWGTASKPELKNAAGKKVRIDTTHQPAEEGEPAPSQGEHGSIPAPAEAPPRPHPELTRAERKRKRKKDGLGNRDEHRRMEGPG